MKFEQKNAWVKNNLEVHVHNKLNQGVVQQVNFSVLRIVQEKLYDIVRSRIVFDVSTTVTEALAK